MSRIGAPFDDYLLEDFENIDRSYKVYLFSNALYITTQLRTKILEKLNRDEATAIWFYAPGFVSDLGCRLDQVKELTGISVDKVDMRDFLQVRITQDSHAFSRDIDDSQEYGTETGPSDIDASIWKWWDTDRASFMFSPMFYVDDKDAEVLGELKAIKKPGLVVKNIEKHRSVYSSAPQLPYQVIRNILENSGGHIYSRKGDLIYANSRYLTVFARGSGKKEIFLPGKFNVFDAITGDSVVKSANVIRYAAKDRETQVFRLD